MELETTSATTSSPESASASATGTVAAPAVEAPSKAAPADAAPKPGSKLKSPEEYWKPVRERDKERLNEDRPHNQPATNANASTSARPAEAPASAAVAAPENATTATATSPGASPTTETTAPGAAEDADLRAENARLKEQVQQFEQARQVEETYRLTRTQKAELDADKALIEKNQAAYARKYEQVASLWNQMQEARQEGDFEAVEKLTQQYNDAYDDARVLAESGQKLDADYQKKSKTFEAEYNKVRESDNLRTLEHIFRPVGLEVKAVLDEVPANYRQNLVAIAETALKKLNASKNAEIADLKKQLAEADAKANAQARDKWDRTNPGSVPHKNISGGGNSGGRKWSPTDSPRDWFRPVKLD